MDDRTYQTMMQMAMAAMNQNPVRASSIGNSANPFSFTDFASAMPEEDNFFGPIGSLVSTMVPGLSTTGPDGQPIPVFKTNFRAKNTGMTGLQNMQMRQNQRAFSQATIDQQNVMGRDWGTLFGQNSLLNSAIENSSMGQGMKDGAHMLMGLLGSPMGAKIAQPMLNSLLGYDRGAGASVINQKSPWMTAAYMRNTYMRNGAALQETSNGYQTLDTLNDMPLYNPFSEDATKTRAALAGIASKTTQDVMWNGNVKRDGVHGASEAFVADIISNAIGSGYADKIMHERGGPSIQQMVDERKNKQDEVNTLTQRQSEASRLLEEANARGDTETAMRMTVELGDLAEKLKEAQSGFEEAGKKLSEGMKPLVESVTNVTSYLKDFYGDESAAREALDNLTGGQGSRDKGAADRLRDNLNEITALGAMAGLDPSVTGSILESTRHALGQNGSNLAKNSGSHGAQAIGFTKDLLMELIGSGLDPKEAGDQINAHNEAVAEWDQSRAKKVIVSLLHARQNGLFAGNEGQNEFAELMDLATSGSVEDLDNVIRKFGTKYFGSEEQFKEAMENAQDMATYEKDLDLDETGESHRLLDEARRRARFNEMDRKSDDAGYTADEKRQIRALRQAGISQDEIDKAVGTSDFLSMSKILNGDDDALYKSALQSLGIDTDKGDVVTDENAQKAKELAASWSKQSKTASRMLNREYELALKEIGGDPNDPETQRKAMEMASRAFDQKGYRDMLSTDFQDYLYNGRAQDRGEELRALEFFDNRANGTIADKGGFFTSVGAADEYGLTRASMSAATQDMVQQLYQLGGAAKTKGGESVDPKQIAEFQDKFKKLMESGKYEEARDLASGFVGNLDDDTRSVLEAKLKKETYRTTSQIEATAQADDRVQKVEQEREMATTMGNMSEDAKRKYIELVEKRKRTVDPEEMKNIDEQLKTMREEAEKQSKSDAEKIIEAAQSGDLKKFMEIFKNGNADLESFFTAIKQIAGFMGVTTTTTGEFSASVESRAGESKEERRRRIDELRGGHVHEDPAAEYAKHMRKAVNRQDKSEYLEALKMEDKFSREHDSELAKREKELAKEVGGGTSSAKLKAELDALGPGADPGKRRDLEKRLAAARELDETAAKRASLQSASEEREAERQRVKGMSDAEFAQYMKGATDMAPPSEKGGGGGGSGGGDGKSPVDMAGLCRRLDSLITVLQNRDGPRGSNSY